MTYGVKVVVAKAADLAKAKTYSWTVSQPSPDKTVDAQIVAAVDRELSALGFTKAASGTGDVQATYASTRRTDVNLKGKADASGVRPAYEVGTLLVDLRDPATREPLFRVRIDTPVTTEADKAEARDRRGGEGDVREIPGTLEALNRSSDHAGKSEGGEVRAREHSPERKKEARHGPSETPARPASPWRCRLSRRARTAKPRRPPNRAGRKPAPTPHDART